MEDEYTYQNYWQFIKDTVSYILEESQDDEDRHQELIQEAADQTRWSFMYWGAHNTLQHTQHKDYWEEIFGSFSEFCDGCNSIEDIEVKMAFWAIYGDLSEALADKLETV